MVGLEELATAATSGGHNVELGQTLGLVKGGGASGDLQAGLGGEISSSELTNQLPITISSSAGCSTVSRRGFFSGVGRLTEVEEDEGVGSRADGTAGGGLEAEIRAF